jgi:polyisoprenoid-binding protein YceI
MSSPTLTSTKTYIIDAAHSAARFWVRHLMVAKVHGTLGELSGTVSLDPANPEDAQVEVTIPLSSLSTGQDQRDAHLRSADFFDIDTFPTITFKSKSIKRIDGNEFEVAGDLTIRDVTREVTLAAEISDEIASPFGGYKIGVSATGKINREDFGMTWNQVIEAGGVAVGKDVHLQIDAELDRAA